MKNLNLQENRRLKRKRLAEHGDTDPNNRDPVFTFKRSENRKPSMPKLKFMESDDDEKINSEEG
jgi:hypothetical protein